VGDGLACARDGEVLAAMSRESGELVVGDRACASRGPCLAGWRGDGDARRVARGSEGGVVRRRGTWPGFAGERAHDVLGMAQGARFPARLWSISGKGGSRVQ
jgi:hypothetical protein